MPDRMRLFIGSSSEGLNIAREIQAELDHEFESTIWTQGVFNPSQGTLDALVTAARSFDFALLVVHAVDTVESRGERVLAPRDNLLFELGLFMGTLGSSRTFFLYNRDDPPKLPSDLAGVTALTFSNRSDGNLRAAVGPACQSVREQGRRQGPRIADPYAQLGAVELGNRARRLRDQGRLDEALIVCDRGISIDPKYEFVWTTKCGLLRELGRYEAALAVADEALLRFPHSANVLSAKGFVLWSMKSYEAALELFDRALEIQPTHERALFYRGHCLESLGELDAAIEAYDRMEANGVSEEYVRKARARGAEVRRLRQDA